MSKVQITFKGKKAWKHDDGSIRDSKGLWLGKPEGAIENWDAEAGRQANERKLAETERAVDKGMQDGLNKNTPLEAIEGMASGLAQSASDPDNPRQVTAYRALLDTSGRVASQRQQAGSPAGLQLTVGAEGIEALAGLLSRLGPPPDVIEGTVIEERPAEADGAGYASGRAGEAGEEE